jgi:hypothetical protein
VAIPDHDDPENGDDGCSEIMDNGQSSTSQEGLTSPRPGTEQPRLPHFCSSCPCTTASKSDGTTEHQISVLFTATQMKKILEEAELKRQIKGKRGNKAKQEKSKKRAEVNTQNNKKHSGNTRHGSSKKKQAENHEQGEICFDEFQMRKTEFV